MEEKIDLSTPLALKLKRQLEYYFGDINFPRDKWMRAKAAENNGYIPIALLLTFNRIKESTSDLQLVTEVLKSIPDLEVDDGKVKRLKPVPDTFDFKSASNCTALLRGFPKPDPIVTIDEVTELIIPFANPINIYRKRNHQTKEFTGKVLIQFNSPEEAQKVLDVKELIFKDQKISVLTQEQYLQVKTEELAKLGITYQKPAPKRQKEKSENFNQRKKMKLNNREPEIKEEKKDEITITKGLLIEVKNVPLGIPLADLKAYFARFGTVQFIDLSKRDEHQIILVRFSNPTEATGANAEIGEKKMEINGNILESRLVTGEEEDKYWTEEIIPLMKNKSKMNKNQRPKFQSQKKKNKRQRPNSSRKPDTEKNNNNEKKILGNRKRRKNTFD